MLKMDEKTATLCKNSLALYEKAIPVLEALREDSKMQLDAWIELEETDRDLIGESLEADVYFNKALELAKAVKETLEETLDSFGVER